MTLFGISASRPQRRDPNAGNRRSLSRTTIESLASRLGECYLHVKGFVHLREDDDRRDLYQQIGPRWSLEPMGDWNDAPARTLW
ncbi:GTP-binding protein [Thiocystis violascens]|uniref:GTP-binding protein n=1 Tax=Thiocystis violascens TaxID=73141 RepID=UPI0012F64D49|nr:GTP-binding protein [Thiocystis violascens]